MHDDAAEAEEGDEVRYRHEGVHAVGDVPYQSETDYASYEDTGDVEHTVAEHQLLAAQVLHASFSIVEIDEIARCSSHLTFNSLSQYARYHERVKKNCPDIQLGLRVNPEYSEVGTLLYNPCAPGTRFGVTADKLPEELPSDIEGFHCHCHGGL